MCGIAGFLSEPRFVESEADEILKRMTDVIAYRGPDASGYRTGDTAAGRIVGLGHRRLSIIDLAGGRQPMAWQDGRFLLTFNGEIYNFRELRAELAASGARFATKSDTEVILAAYEKYGWRCVEKFRGMFAFALWDETRQLLVLARDRFGKKPLYYTDTPGGIVFGSEVKSLLEFPGIAPDVDRRAVWDYFALRYVPGPRTLFDGVHKLPPGCVLLQSPEDRRIERYFTPPDAVHTEGPMIESPAEGTARVAELLEDAVAARLVSDVPFGAFLSGGIDSSLVVALMARHLSEPVNTFSVVFKEEPYSEARYSKLVAERFGTAHYELVVNSRDIMDYLHKLVHLRDAPVAEPSDIPIYLLSVEAARHVKMVLTGEGSDEIFGGYPKHVYERYAGISELIPEALRSRVLLPLIRGLPYSWYRYKTGATALCQGDWHERMACWFGALNEQERSRLLREPGPRLGADPVISPVPDKRNSRLKRILAFDQVSWLPDNLLERGDRMTMGASLEARMPYMDHELVGTVARLADDLRIRGRTTKWVLREVARQLLPEVIIKRPKVGFRVPVNIWFRTQLREHLTDTLLGANAKTRDYYHRDELARVLDEHFRGRQNHEKLIWAMLNLELWHQEYA